MLCNLSKLLSPSSIFPPSHHWLAGAAEPLPLPRRCSSAPRGVGQEGRRAAQAPQRAEPGRVGDELSGACKEVGDVRDLSPPWQGLCWKRHPARRHQHRPRCLPGVRQDQHLQLDQDCEDLLQKETVFHPAEKGAYRILRHSLRIQPFFLPVLQKPVEISR